MHLPGFNIEPRIQKRRWPLLTFLILSHLLPVLSLPPHLRFGSLSLTHSASLSLHLASSFSTFICILISYSPSLFLSFFLSFVLFLMLLSFLTHSLRSSDSLSLSLDQVNVNLRWGRHFMLDSWISRAGTSKSNASRDRFIVSIVSITVPSRDRHKEIIVIRDRILIKESSSLNRSYERSKLSRYLAHLNFEKLIFITKNWNLPSRKSYFY